MLFAASIALADDEPAGGKVSASTSHDPRTSLVTAFADQRASVDRAANAVELKLADAVEVRKARVRAAYKLLRVDDLGPRPEARGPRPEAADAGGLAIARRRAAVRWLLSRDRLELGLLADEANRLLAARRRIDRDAELAATIDLPAGLIWPARGTISRRFGPYVHEKSGATLTRRGLDLDVAPDAGVIAPAAGTVAYAGPIRGLDQGVIVDHGTFLTVIAKLDTPVVRAGDKVDQGTPLGHPRRHRVYLEVRAEVGPGGTPIDPEAVLPTRP
jgi:murein DD-endopeptidase MepM/ murein hydrolase activator NlpD